MAFIPVANTAAVRVQYDLAGFPAENTLYFNHDGPIDQANLQALADGVAEWWFDNLRLASTTNMSLSRVIATDLTVENGIQYTSLVHSGETGTVLGESLPSNVTLAVSFRTAFTGRSFRGRNYFVGLAEAQVLENTVSAGTITHIVNDYNQLISSPPAVNWNWVVVSRYSHGAPRAAGVATPVTLALVTDALVDTQRRRIHG